MVVDEYQDPDTKPLEASTLTGVAAIGDLVDIGGFGLAGVIVRRATTAEEVRAAWADLPPEIGLVIVDAAADRHLAGQEDAGRLRVVMPR